MTRKTGGARILIAAALALICCLAATAAWAGSARNIIIFVGDGMHLEHEIAASNYLYGEDFALSWQGFEYQNFASTWDTNTYNAYAAAAGAPEYDPDDFDPRLGYDPERGGHKPSPLYEDTAVVLEYFFPGFRPVLEPKLRKGPGTDSAAAATALAAGIKTSGGRVSWDAAGEPGGELVTIAELMREHNGAAVGAVSTVPFSHATPAAFVSHNVSRGNTYTGRRGWTGLGIADEILTVIRPEVVIGAGHPKWDNRRWDTDSGYISRRLYEAMAEDPGYVFVERNKGEDGARLLFEAAARAVEEDRKLFGLFGGGRGNFEPPVPADSPGAPRVTPGSPENPLLRDATIAALEVLSANENGFFVIIEQGDIDWANHANDFQWMIGTTWDLNEAVLAAVEFVDAPGNGATWDDTLIIVTSDHGNNALRIDPDKPLGPGRLPRQICDVVFGCRYPNGEVKFYTTGHTNELVGVYARGAGVEAFEKYEGAWYPGTRLIDQVHVFKAMRDAALGQ